MRTLLFILASTTVWIYSASAAAEDALWRCMDQNGLAVYTNKTQGLKDCQKYDVKSDRLEVRPSSKPSDTDLKLQPNPVLAEEHRAAEPLATGLIDFATMNRLALGMTQAQVLSIAGPPKSKLTDAWVYSLADASTVEVRFGTGRIVEIRSHQLP